MPRGNWGQIEGMKEAREALQELSKSVQGGVGKRALNAPGDVFVRSIKSKAQVSGRAGNPTPGSLRESVRKGKASTRKGVSRLELVAEDVAAVPNEFGTSKMTAQPFFRPGIESARVEAAGAMAEAVKSETDRAVERAAKRAARG